MLQILGAVNTEQIFIRFFNNDDSGKFIFVPRMYDYDDDEDIDDDFNDDEEEDENPFDIEPTDKDILESDFPIDNPEDDLLDDDEDIPYN